LAGQKENEPARNGERAEWHRAAAIADPAFDMCREQWDQQTLRTLWQGYAFELVRR
jgi:hypothetical protein